MNEAFYTHFSHKVFETLCAFYASAQLTVDQGSIATRSWWPRGGSLCLEEGGHGSGQRQCPLQPKHSASVALENA